MNRRRFVFLGISGLLAAAGTTSAGAPRKLLRPVAVGLGDHSLFILEGSGRLLQLGLEDPLQFGELRVIVGDGIDQGIDLTMGKWSGHRVMAVSCRRLYGTSAKVSLISVFDAESANAGSTSFGNLFVRSSYLSGLAFNHAGDRLYLAGATDGTICFSERSSRSLSPIQILTVVRGVAQLGTMLHDPTNPWLYVCDPIDGVLYRVDTETGKSRDLAHDLGSPTSLLYRPQQGDLLISDALNGRILSLKPGATKSTVLSIPTSVRLRIPVGLALLPSGVLCIADSWNSRLIFLQGDQVVGRYPEGS